MQNKIKQAEVLHQKGFNCAQAVGIPFAEELGNEYQNSTATVLVTAEAVQVANNPVPADGTVEDVLGWPSDTEGGEA